MIRAVFYDMDGLMVNTEPIQSLAYEKVLKQIGITPVFNRTKVVQKIGVRERDNWQLMKKSYGLQQEVSQLMKMRESVYTSLLRKNVAPQPGLIELIQLLETKKIKMGIASSSSSEHIRIVISRLNIQDKFAALVSGESVERGKPAPDIYLKIADELQIAKQDHEKCIVLEDAQSGIEAGKAAGMKVIAVPNKFTEDHDISRADLTVHSLQHITWEMLELVTGNRIIK